MADDIHPSLPPSAWLLRWAHLLPAGGTVLDLACGSGRHVRWLAQRGWRVTAVDRDAQALAPLRALAPAVEVVLADIEAGPWPLPGRRFDVVVVTHYLWRPLLARIAESLAADGVLLYETYAQGQQLVGKPSNPAFLLQSGELLRAFAGLRIIAFEDGFEGEPGRYVQRLVAVAQAPDASPAPRYGLAPRAG